MFNSFDAETSIAPIFSGKLNVFILHARFMLNASTLLSSGVRTKQSYFICIG